MKKIFLLFIGISFSWIAAAQQENEPDSIAISGNREIPENPELIKRIEPEYSFTEELLPEVEEPLLLPTPGKLKVSPLKYVAYPYNQLPGITYHNQHLYDFSTRYYYTITDKSSVSSYHFMNTYPAMGAVIQTGALYNFQVNDRLVLSAGAYGAQYNINRFTQSDVGLNAQVYFQLHERVGIRGFGQYSGMAGRNRLPGPLSPMFPQSGYGGALQFKITEKFSLEAGMEREFDPVRRKWINRPYFAPVFHSK
ncbi:MAG: hypothetical protein LUD15_04025 [Bacteroides sp.]|nr:hypothetical protein [Bacteroides sp.]